MPTETKQRSQVELIKALIEKEPSDSEKLAGLYDELTEAIEADALTKATAKLQADHDKEQRDKVLAEKGATTQKIEINEAGEYKGFKLKRFVEGVKSSRKLRDSIRKSGFTNEQIEKQGITMAELFLKSGAVIAPDGKIYTGQIPPGAAKAYTEGTTTAGGYLVPSEQRFEILAYLRDASPIVDMCRHVPMISDEQTIPTESTSVSINITAEASDATATSGTFGVVTLTAKRHDATTLVTNELLNDNAYPGGFLAFLMEEFVEAQAMKMESAVLLGPGDPVSGIFKKFGTSVVFTTGSTNFSALLEADIRSLIAGVSARFFPGMSFIMGHKTLWNYVYGLKDTQSRNLFIPSMTEGPPGRVMGKTVYTPTNAIDTTAAGTAMIVLADLARGFIIGDRLTDMSMFIDPYTNSKSYQTAIHIFTRYAYANALTNYFAAIKSAAT